MIVSTVKHHVRPTDLLQYGVVKLNETIRDDMAMMIVMTLGSMLITRKAPRPNGPSHAGKARLKSS